MLFNSLTFLVFFAVVLGLYRLPMPWTGKKGILLGASYLFYAAWNPPFVLLLWLSTIVDWLVARRLYRAEGPHKRRVLLLVSLAVNLGVLGFFKYGTFFLENTVALLDAMGVAWQPAAPDIILPVGISFYTFQTMAYTLDIYLGRAEPEKSFLDFALFVTFFPQLVAGPIVRPTDLIPQFAEEKRIERNKLLWGLGLMILGLFQKVVIADTLLSVGADEVFGKDEPIATLDAWLGTLAFSGQILCDFAGYTTTAIGAALCLGFSLPDNFRYPYAAIGFSDFWRRWHISLSSWLRDYLYIPLGGNRRGLVRTEINLMITMLLGGLWHGARWTFVVWGALHGIYLVAERLLRKATSGTSWTDRPAVKVVLALLTYALVNVAWVFFRAPDFSTALDLVAAMFGFGGELHPLLMHDVILIPVVIGCLLLLHAYMRGRALAPTIGRLPWPIVAIAWAVMIWLLIVSQGSSNAFIYFQF